MPISNAGVGSEILADRLFKYLVGERNAELPEVNLFDSAHTIPWNEGDPIYAPVEKVSIEELMKQFHLMMGGFREHLEQEFEKGRITGAKYSEVYIALTQTAMTSAVQFALGKDQAFWLAAKTQAEAITAKNQNEVTRLEAMLRRATYALTKLKLATEDSAFGSNEYQRTEIMPAQKQSFIEQAEAQRGQTLDIRYSDNLPITGLIDTQKQLYGQQIQSYKENAKINAAQVFATLWTTQKTVEDGTFASRFFAAPNDLDGSTALDSIFAATRKTAMGDYQEEHGFNPNPLP